MVVPHVTCIGPSLSLWKDDLAEAQKKLMRRDFPPYLEDCLFDDCNLTFMLHNTMTPNGDIEQGQRNGLLPDGTKPLPEPMLTNRWWEDIYLEYDV